MLDVNYGGSTGYGREYRNRLKGNWGVVDVDDCCSAVEAMVAAGRVCTRAAVLCSVWCCAQGLWPTPMSGGWQACSSYWWQCRRVHRSRSPYPAFWRVHVRAAGETSHAQLFIRVLPHSAGASYYGVSSLEALATDTHKFESRYLDELVGPWPQVRLCQHAGP